MARGIASSGPPLTAITNAAVELHRRYFGRGPGAARSSVTDDLIVCVLTDVFTPMERALIAAGYTQRVRETRSIHQAALEEVYVQRMAAASGRPVAAHLSTVDVRSEVSVEIFVLGER